MSETGMSSSASHAGFSSSKSLMEALGGEPGIKQVSEVVYKKMLSNPLFKPMFAIKKPQMQSEMISKFIYHIVGVKVFNRLKLKNCHGELKLEKQHFDEMMKILEEAFDAHGLDEFMIKKLLKYSKSTENDILAQGYKSGDGVSFW